MDIFDFIICIKWCNPSHSLATPEHNNHHSLCLLQLWGGERKKKRKEIRLLFAGDTEDQKVLCVTNTWKHFRAGLDSDPSGQEDSCCRSDESRNGSRGGWGGGGGHKILWSPSTWISAGINCRIHYQPWKSNEIYKAQAEFCWCAPTVGGVQWDVINMVVVEAEG